MLSPIAARLLKARVDAEKCRRSLKTFVRAAWPTVEPAMAYRESWHNDAICDHLEQVSLGNLRKLIINIPPGHGKSLLVSVLWPAWIWTWRPEWRGIFSAYALDLATRDAMRARALIESEWYQNSFIRGEVPGLHRPLFEFSDDSNRKDLYTNTKTGSRTSIAVGSKATGFRANCVVVDDPLNAKDAPSKIIREECIYWWSRVMTTRVNDPQKDAFVVIMQRLHCDDLTGYLLATDKDYEHLCLPSEFRNERRTVTHIRQPGKSATVFENGRYYTKTDLGEKVKFFEDPRTVEGELLFPDLYPQRVLDDLKPSLGSAAYAAQHDQLPSPEGGGMFKLNWWRFWRHPGSDVNTLLPRPKDCSDVTAINLPRLAYVFGSVDCAFKDKPDSDYVVATVWGCRGADRFLLDIVRAKLDFTATCQMLVRLHEKWKRHQMGQWTFRCMKWLVEDKANGPAVVTALQNRIPGLLPVNPEGGKESRAAAMSPLCEAGNIYLPEGAAWLDDYVTEFANFPGGSHDDQVDSSSQAIIHTLVSTDTMRAQATFGKF